VDELDDAEIGVLRAYAPYLLRRQLPLLAELRADSGLEADRFREAVLRLARRGCLVLALNPNRPLDSLCALTGRGCLVTRDLASHPPATSTGREEQRSAARPADSKAR
jgi:hypothetical protein